MERYTVIDKFEGEFKGFSYTGEVFWDKENRRSFCNIYPQGLGYGTIQRDTYSQAIWEVERVINKYIEDSKIKDSKLFILIRIGREDDYEIGSYYQDLEEFGEEQWICLNNEDCVMSEIESIPGVWTEGENFYVAVQTNEDLYNSPVNEELKNLPMEVLKNAQKFVAKRVKEILKKTS